MQILIMNLLLRLLHKNFDTTIAMKIQCVQQAWIQGGDRGGQSPLYLYTRSKMHQCISGKCTKCIKMHNITTGYVNCVKFSKRILDGSAVFGV